MNSKLSVVVGGQYGSEGKGAIAGHLTKQRNQPVTCVRIGGPNAGHTVLGQGPEGPRTPWRLRTIPVAAVTNHQAQLVIAAGSEIDISVLTHEATLLEQHGHPVWDRLYIDWQATILEPHHITTETWAGLNERVGSTGKGIGAARAERLMRTARIWDQETILNRPPAADTAAVLRAALDDGHHVVIEGTQGYGLGLHAGHYPQCTSGDARAVDFLAAAGLSPWADNIDDFHVYVVARANPIRVSGNSGPLKGETTWAELNLEPELTTVTRKVRRVGAWDSELVRDAIQANGAGAHVSICLTMLDHAIPEVANWTGPLDQLPGRAQQTILDVQRECGALVSLVGTGPDTVAGDWA